MEALVIIAIGWIVYRVLTRKKRAERRELEAKAREQKKQDMLNDSTISVMADTICNILTNLEDAAVKLLRTGGHYYLIFEKGNVYYETRWTEKIGEHYEQQKNTQCILDRIDLGKNPLDNEQNLIFKDIVYDKLRETSWMDVSSNYKELTVRKAKNTSIPEVGSEEILHREDTNTEAEAIQKILNSIHALQDELYSEEIAQIDREKAAAYKSIYSAMLEDVKGNSEKVKAYEDVIMACIALEKDTNPQNSRILDEKIEIAEKINS